MVRIGRGRIRIPGQILHLWQALRDEPYQVQRAQQRVQLLQLDRSVLVCVVVTESDLGALQSLVADLTLTGLSRSSLPPAQELDVGDVTAAVLVHQSERVGQPLFVVVVRGGSGGGVRLWLRLWAWSLCADLLRAC